MCIGFPTYTLGAAHTRQAAVCGAAVYILRFCAILHQLLSVKLFTTKGTTEYAAVDLRAPRQMALLYLNAVDSQ